MHVPPRRKQPISELLGMEVALKNIREFLSHFGFAQHEETPENVVRLEAKELCRRFNEGGYEMRVEQGLLIRNRTGLRHVKPDTMPDNCTWCTNSVEHTYIDAQTNLEVAIVHSYERPDGTLGASGMRDPKLLIEDGIEYHLPRKKKVVPPQKQNPRMKKLRTKWRRFRFHAVGRLRKMFG
jgi:hypothetical protein